MTGVHTPFLAARELGVKLEENQRDYDVLLDMARDRRFALLGEATHGTREFYRMRAELTRRLIEEAGFEAVAIEGDWPDVWRVNRFVQCRGEDDAESSLEDFQRFPTWMWRNREVLEFVTWLRDRNSRHGADKRVGLYGLDLYSLYRSADAVIRYLEDTDPEKAEQARQHYRILDHVREPQAYGYEAALGLRPSAREAVVAQLLQLRADAVDHVLQDGLAARDAYFFAERNATVVVSAEAYYRAMFGHRISTWNLRDAHMRDTLLALANYLRQRGGEGRVVVWAHNSHLGDARATEAHLRGEWNLGQLMREVTDQDSLLVGFTTYTGHVSAASEWDAAVERKRIRPALRDSYEYLFHTTGLDRFFLPLRGETATPLREMLLERAIGVVYRPETERASHYFNASIANQFDALFHIDETSALEPLEVPHHWREPEVTESA